MVGFTTKFLGCEAPTFVTPTDGGVLYSTDRISVTPQEGARSNLIEVAATSTVTGRSRYVETMADHSATSSKVAAEIKLGSSSLKVGGKYYARARAIYINTGSGNTFTDYCPVISFTYKLGKGDFDGNGQLSVADVTTLVNYIAGVVTLDQEQADVNGDGHVDVADVTALINLILSQK